MNFYKFYNFKKSKFYIVYIYFIRSQKTEEKASDSKVNSSSSPQLARVIGVLPRALPGLTNYDDSSDSASSSSDSEADFSLSGRNSVILVAKQQIQQAQQ